MDRRGILVGLLVAAIGGAAAVAQPDPVVGTAIQGPRPGQKLKDSKGAPVGQIEKVIADADGRPRQVLVRVARVLRVLPVDALTRSGDAYVTVLTRAELESLPAAS
jgi:hypothetical protein